MSRLSGGRLASQLTFLNFKSASSAGTIIFYFPRGPSCIWILTRYLEILRRCTFLPSWLYFSFPFVAVLCTHFWMAVRFLHALFRGFFFVPVWLWKYVAALSVHMLLLRKTQIDL